MKTTLTLLALALMMLTGQALAQEDVNRTLTPDETQSGVMAFLFLAIAATPAYAWLMVLFEKEKKLQRAGYVGEDAKWKIGRGKFALFVLIAFVSNLLTLSILSAVTQPKALSGFVPPPLFWFLLSASLFVPFLLRLRDLGWPKHLAWLPLVSFPQVVLLWVSITRGEEAALSLAFSMTGVSAMMITCASLVLCLVPGKRPHGSYSETCMQ